MKNGVTRKAFTLIEAVVCIGIIGVLLSLTAVGVQYVRETARRSQCQDTMRQVSLALLAAESHHKAFPSGSFGYSNKYPSGPLVAVLPYLERDDDFTRAHLHEECGPDFDRRNNGLPVLCPSDGTSTGTNIRFNSGSSIFHFQADHERGANGVFPGDKRVKASEILDGLSNTCAISERPIGKDGDISNQRALGILMPWSGINTNEVQDLEFGPPSNLCDWSGRTVLVGMQKHLSYSHVAPPNAKGFDVAFCPEACSHCGQARISARSFHSGVVNVGFADGHMEFISNSIDVSIWRSLGTRDGAEVVSVW